MNATAFEGGKVHLLTDQAARCGVGKHARRGHWQTDLGEVTCQRCVKLERVDQKHLALASPQATEVAGMNGRGMGTGTDAGGGACATIAGKGACATSAEAAP
jgi:hypothetical protein